MKQLALLLLTVILVSGCSTPAGDGLAVTLSADPARVFSGSSTRVHMDVDNRNTRQIENVMVKLFDTGMLEGNVCEKSFERLLPGEFQSLSCTLFAPSVTDPVQTEISSRVSYESVFSVSQIFEVMSEQEYQRRTSLGDFRTSPKIYTYRDKNIQMDVEFSEQPPLVLTQDKKQFIYFTITNVGDGFVREINPGDLADMSTEKIMNCPSYNTLYPDGKTFPRLACELVLPPEYLAASSFRNVDIILGLRYTYEVRNSLRLDIVR